MFVYGITFSISAYPVWTIWPDKISDIFSQFPRFKFCEMFKMINMYDTILVKFMT